jgi:hypothetical protein
MIISVKAQLSPANLSDFEEVFVDLYFVLLRTFFKIRTQLFYCIFSKHEKLVSYSETDIIISRFKIHIKKFDSYLYNF